jgi:hypothetical protein
MKAAILLLILITSASGQIIIDPEGDVNTTILEDQQIPIGPQAFDLLQLDAVESRDTIDFTATIANFQRTTDTGLNLFTGFQFDDTEFLCIIEFSSLPIGDITSGYLYKRPAGGAEWVNQNITYATVTDGAPATVKFTVDRNDIQNEIGFTPYEGDKLESFWMAITDEITRSQIVGGLPRLAPYIHFDDNAESNNVLQLEQGQEQRKGIQLHSPEPIRRTNGDAQTILFNVTATNFEEGEVSLQVKALNIPNGWEVTPIRPFVNVPGQSTISIPIAVSIPFKHNHGDTVTTEIVIENLETESKLDSLNLGLYFLKTPLPSGHHDTVWLHSLGDSNPNALGGSRGMWTAPFLTTLEQTPEDTRNPIQAHSDDFTNPSLFYWCLPITPAMMIGLDLLEGSGEIGIDFRSELPYNGKLSGRLMLHGDGYGYGDSSRCDRSPGKEIASFGIDSLVLERQVVNSNLIEIPTKASVTPPGMNDMVIELTYEFEAAPAIFNFYPTVEHGMFMTLPLADYEDQIPSFDSISAAKLALEGPSRVQRNPGAVAIFEFNLEGDGMYDLELIGNQDAWASLPSLDSPAGPVIVIIEVPDSADIGDVLELVLQAENDSGFALAQFSVEVAEGEYPDDAAQANEIQNEREETPFPTILLVLAVLSVSFNKLRKDW